MIPDTAPDGYGAAEDRPQVSSAMTSIRLRRSGEIRAVFSHGARAHGRAVVVHGRVREDAGPARWTVVAGRKVGGAVARNRAKRRVRAQLRELALPRGVDLVVVAREAAKTVEAGVLGEELERLVRTACADVNGVQR